MVLDFFKLSEQPFGVTPDPRYLYFSATHREALASALYGVSCGRGFTTMIAQPGMGKTTLLFDFLQKVRNHAKTVFLFQPQADPRDLLRSLLADIGIEDQGNDFVRMHRKLNEVLLAESRLGRRLVVVLDEAQNLSDEVLEAVRMLSNFETPREKLMHLVLAGQPQLAEKLASPQLIQLRQRISIIARLQPFNTAETEKYIEHRLRVAGYDFATAMFTPQALETIAKYSQGIPRNINNVCFNSMSLGFVAKQRTIDDGMVREVIDDLDLNIDEPEPVKIPPVTPQFTARPTDTTAAPEAEPRPKARHIVAKSSVLMTAESSVPMTAKSSVPMTAKSSVPMTAKSSVPMTAKSSVPMTARSSVPMTRKLGPQLALAGTLVVALSWLGIQSKRHTGEVLASPGMTMKKKPTVADKSSVPAPVAPVAASAATPSPVVASDSPEVAKSANSNDWMMVDILPGDTVYDLCSQAFGRCDDGTLARIQAMNPWLKDLNHIESGQQVRVPVSNESPVNHGTTERIPAALSTGAER
jgi:general secretion pathway protein A